MKWFKHETDAHSNLKLQAVINKYGLEGFGYYWAIVELVGLQGENYSIEGSKDWQVYLSKFVNISLERQQELLNFFADKKLIDAKELGKGNLSIPKLAERSDEYTKRVRRMYGHNSDNVRAEEKRRDKKRTDKKIGKAPALQKKTDVMLYEEQPEGDMAGKVVNDCIKLFEPINPTFERLFANKTERAAVERMLVKFGAEKLVAMLKALPTVVAQKFAPRVTKPTEFENKLGHVMQFLQQEKQPKGNQKVHDI